MQLRPSGIVTLTTDFGTADPYVAIMKGAAIRAAPKAQLVDVTHALPKQDVEAAAFCQWALVGRFPGGSVHVAVVDPGVGTGRRLLAVAAHGVYWLAPDNGLLGTVIATAAEPDVRALDLEHLGIRPESATFHGRDVLAPVAAALAAGRYGFSALGPRVADLQPADPVFDGSPRIVHVDDFGNLISNVTQQALGAATTVAIGGHDVPVRRTYGDVPPGELLAYVGSFGLLEVGNNGGSAAAVLGLARGAPVATSTA
jgi:S-adenosylmethionine hydrolase